MYTQFFCHARLLWTLTIFGACGCASCGHQLFIWSHCVCCADHRMRHMDESDKLGVTSERTRELHDICITVWIYLHCNTATCFCCTIEVCSDSRCAAISSHWERNQKKGTPHENILAANKHDHSMTSQLNWETLFGSLCSQSINTASAKAVVYSSSIAQ